MKKLIIFLILFIVVFISGCGVEGDFSVGVYDPEKAYDGTTLLPCNYDPENPRVIEINMQGDIIWEYAIPENLKEFTNPGFDAEYLPEEDHILIVLPRSGIYEIDRDGQVVWTHMDPKISHDADRLDNGNTLYVYGGGDKKTDAQVKEVDKDGNIVWEWYAKDYFDKEPYSTIQDEGWTHTNAVTRLENGNTILSPRNFNLLVEVDSEGEVVQTHGEDFLDYQHDPEVLDNGNIVIANHGEPQGAIEFTPEGEIVWEFEMPDRGTWPVRDANRLPNGNTLITGSTVILEVTPEGEVVWEFKINEQFERKESAARGFYKAERI